MIVKCALLFIASALVGLASAAAVMLFVIAVNRWDDAPGGGFLMIGVLAFGGLAGCVAGICSVVALCRPPTEGCGGRPPINSEIKAILLALLGASSLAGAAASILTQGRVSALILIVLAVAFASKAAKMTLLRPRG
jgi:hypothetical protein